MSQRPQPIRTDTSNAFAHNTMRVRVPKIIRDVQARNPDYPPQIHAALDRLHNEIAGDQPIQMVELLAPDHESWAAAYSDHAGETWQNSSSWFFCETYFYRRLIESVRWLETGRDPFAPWKDEEWASESLWETLDHALALRGEPMEERLPTLIVQALWGNRIDLSFAAALAHGRHWTDEDLLVGDENAVAEYLRKAGGAVHIVHDNAGSELTMDLALVDALLDGIAEQIILHLKWHPTFVSDATVPDLLHCLNLMADGKHGNHALGLAERLRSAFVAGRLRFAPDPYWNSSRFAWDLPPHLTELFQKASLVIFKGDANYRRVVGDALWPAHTPLRDVVALFPAPVLLMRTLKSDPVVGLPENLAARLDATDPIWRVNGRRGLIQAALK